MKYLIFRSIRIDLHKSSFEFFPFCAFLIASYDFFIECSPLFFELITSFVKGTLESQINIHIKVKNHIWEEFFNGFFIDPDNPIHPESLSLSLDNTRREKTPIRNNDITTLECGLHYGLECLSSRSSIEIGICEWVHCFMFPVFYLCEVSDIFGDRSRSRFTDMDYSFSLFSKILHEPSHLCRLPCSDDALECYVHSSTIQNYPKNEMRIIPNNIIDAPINRWNRCFSWKNHPPSATAKSADADLNALV